MGPQRQSCSYSCSFERTTPLAQISFFSPVSRSVYDRSTSRQTGEVRKKGGVDGANNIYSY